MRIKPFICLLISLHVILFLTVSCGRGHKGFYETKYPQVDFTLSVPNRYQVKEAYEGKNEEGLVYRRIDSTGINNVTKDPASPGKDTNAVDEKKIIGDPNYFFVILNKKNAWNLFFNAILSGKYQDTVVVYDKEKMGQKDFLQTYVFGPGRDSAFYANLTSTEITKDGKKLYKIVNADGTNITYTGMIDKYWFMLQFTASGKDTVWVRKIWDQSHFD